MFHRFTAENLCVDVYVSRTACLSACLPACLPASPLGTGPDLSSVTEFYYQVPNPACHDTFTVSEDAW